MVSLFESEGIGADQLMGSCRHVGSRLTYLAEHQRELQARRDLSSYGDDDAQVRETPEHQQQLLHHRLNSLLQYPIPLSVERV